MQLDGSKEPNVAWDADSQSLIDWYRAHRSRFPASPFKMGPWIRVMEPVRFFAMIDVDIAAGPLGSKAMRGVLQEDLRRLRKLFDESSVPLGTAAASV
jgi:hypothetical protein